MSVNSVGAEIMQMAGLPQQGASLPQVSMATPGMQPTGQELRHFLANEPAGYDWLVPGLLERQDRLILTGGEGDGKSTLLRQMGMQLSSGIHPFNGTAFIQPSRVLLFDLENTKRQVYRKVNELMPLIDERYSEERFIIVNQPEGLDFTQGDGQILETEISAAQPDVLIIGPLYKMVAGDPNEEGPARIVASWLDRMRVQHGCAVLTEAHTPHGKEIRPYGASLWKRWPEFGLHLSKDGRLQHWRGARDERDFPAALQRGGTWPWTQLTRDRDVLWARIQTYTSTHGKTSQRKLAEQLGVKPASVQRAIEEHKDAYAQLAMEIGDAA